MKKLAQRLTDVHMPEFEEVGLPMVGHQMNAIYPRFGKTYMDPAKRAELEREIREGDYIDMGVGIYFTTSRDVIEAAKKSLDAGKTAYADLPELHDAVSKKLKEWNNIQADPVTEVLPMGGAGTGIIMSAMVLLEPGDEAVVLDPDYLRHAHCSRFMGATVKRCNLAKRNGEFYFDPEILARTVSAKTKVLWVTNPTNPSGYLFSRQDCEAIAELARKHDFWVVTNELYDQLCYDGNKHFSIASLPGMFERTLTIGGVSKNYDMTGFRVGWVAGPHEPIAQMGDLEFFACMAMAPTAGQYAAVAALTEPLRSSYIKDMMRTYTESRNLVCDMLNSIPGVKCPRPMAGQFAFPDFSELTTNELELALYLKREAHVLTITGSIWGYNARGHLRIALANPLEVQRKGCERMEKALRKYKKARS